MDVLFQCWDQLVSFQSTVTKDLLQKIEKLTTLQPLTSVVQLEHLKPLDAYLDYAPFH